MIQEDVAMHGIALATVIEQDFSTMTLDERMEMKEEVERQLQWKREHDTDFPLGTSILAWPNFLTPYIHDFNVEKFNGDVKDGRFNFGHFNNSRKYPNLLKHSKDHYDRLKYKSIPLYLDPISCIRPRHIKKSDKGYMHGEYRFPIRYTLPGDHPDIMDGGPLPSTAPCIYCLGHSWSDNCKIYLTPFARHSRLRDINYTLYRLHVPQICPGCVSRELGHPLSADCMSRRNCKNCYNGAHHESLCTTPSHVYNMLDPRDSKVELTQESVNEFVWLDRECQYNENKLIHAAEYAETKRIEKDFLSRLNNRRMMAAMADFRQNNANRQMVDEDAPRPINQAAPGFIDGLGQRGALRDCARAPCLDVHYDHPIFRHMKLLYDSVVNIVFDAQLDKHRFYNFVDSQLTLVEKRFKCCSRRCVPALPATFFCKCGETGVCARHMFGNDELIFNPTTTTPRPKCGSCNFRLVMPKVPGNTSCQLYLAKYQVAITGIKLIRAALLKWANSNSSPSPSIEEYKSLIFEPVELLRLQFQCEMCKKFMDNESRVCMKAFCKCGFMLCRFCFLTECQKAQMDIYRNVEVAPCYQVMIGHVLRCSNCEDDADGFGTCTSLTLLATICRALIRAESSNDERSLLDMFQLHMRERGLECTVNGSQRLTRQFAQPTSDLPSREPSPERLGMGGTFLVPYGRPTLNNLREPTSSPPPARSVSDNEHINRNAFTEVSVEARAVAHPSTGHVDALYDNIFEGLPAISEPAYLESDEEADYRPESEDEEFVDDVEDIDDSCRILEKNRRNGVFDENVAATESSEGGPSVNNVVATAHPESVHVPPQGNEGYSPMFRSLQLAHPERVHVPPCSRKRSGATAHPESVHVPPQGNEGNWTGGWIPSANLTAWQKNLLRIKQILVQRKDCPQTLPILYKVEHQAFKYNMLDLESSLADLQGFFCANPDLLTPAAPLPSMSQLSANTPSYADDQNAEVTAHPTAGSSIAESDEEDEKKKEDGENW